MIPGVKEDTRTKVRKHAMHVVAILALLGVLASLGQIIAKGAIAIAKNGFSRERPKPIFLLSAETEYSAETQLFCKEQNTE